MSTIPVVNSRQPSHGIVQCEACTSFLEFPLNLRWRNSSSFTVSSNNKNSGTLLGETTEINVKCHTCESLNLVDLSRFPVASVGRSQQRPSSTATASNSNSPRSTANDRASAAGGLSFRIGSNDNPVSMEYYEILGVSHKATQAEIKKRYYHLAMQYHPDKNKEVGAEEKFQQISEAYQVLSDPELRRRYNEFGPQNNVAPEGGFVNPEEFFKQHFGGGRFTDLIGEISIARDFKDVLVDSMQEEPSETLDTATKKKREQEHVKEREEIRKKRVDHLVKSMLNRIADYMDNPMDLKNAQRFREKISREAEDLKEVSYGVELLHTIGYVYQTKARQYLGKEEFLGLPRFYSQFREKGHIISETYSTLKSAYDLQSMYNTLQEADKKGLDAQQRAVLEEQAATKGMNALWKGSKLEVEGVLREVCDQVLGERGVGKDVLKRRAQAIKIIGSIYEKVRPDADALTPQVP